MLGGYNMVLDLVRKCPSLLRFERESFHLHLYVIVEGH